MKLRFLSSLPFGTSRNKYEGIENGFMDASSIFFYNFCSGVVQKGLRKLMPNPDIKPAVSETFQNLSPDVIKAAFEALGENPNWEEFLSILPNKKEDSSFSNVGCIEKLQLIRDALARIINEHTGSAELAKTFEEFYEANYPIQFPSNYRSELEKSI